MYAKEHTLKDVPEILNEYRKRGDIVTPLKCKINGRKAWRIQRDLGGDVIDDVYTDKGVLSTYGYI